MSKLNGELQYQQSSGRWVDCEDRTEEFLVRCDKYNEWQKIIGREQVLDALNSGKTIRNDSADWYSNCRIKPVKQPPQIQAHPEKTGQLWEPCNCGNEPVYMPLHLCENCWPTE